LEAVKDYQAEIERLSAENKALKKTNKRLNAKLKSELDKKKSFISNFPKLSVDMGLQESEEEVKETKVTRYASNDGIGE
jgi:cell division septum initiation protein DivIVA